MDIAFTECDITPGIGEEMGGYGYYMNRRAEGTMDPLGARVCALRDADTTVVLVQLDLVGLDADHVVELRERIGRGHGLPPEAVLFHCTHTHTGPASSTFFGPGTLTVELRAFLTTHLVGAVGDAMRAWTPLESAAWFDQPFDGIGYNRDAPDGPIDRRLRGLVLTPASGPPILWVNYACHPVTVGVKRHYSADYPGAVARCLAAWGYRCVYLNGPSGDINPLSSRVRWGPGAEDMLFIYGQHIADAVRQAIGSAEPARLEPLACASRMVPLCARVPTQAELQQTIDQARQRLADDPNDGHARVNLESACAGLARLTSDADPGTIPVEVQAVRVGDVVLGAVSAELFTGLGLRMRNASARDRLMLAATSNGLVGYIATADSVARQSYAADTAAKLYDMFPHASDGGERFADDAGRFLGDAV